MENMERYKRNIGALSVEESASLATKRVVVAGCGGLGGYCIEALARIGVGTIVVIDCDVFEESNLNRQRFATETTIGQDKAQVVAQAVRDINSHVEVLPRVERIDEQNARQLVEGADCVIDCLDNLEARFWLGHACQKACVPVVYGAIAGWYGQVCTVYPGDVSFVTVYGEVPAEGAGIELREGNLPFTAACVASFQSAEAVKVLIARNNAEADAAAAARNRILMIDLLFGSVESMELA